ncbi:hypothetical protein ACFQL1_13505 [Halomicroarcula sp. GCM10025709]|uniref:hypothetical protein n=1 Tax=Halomicroarcula sp. GCM10025709 TaxID=3252669 RepID=UPI00361D1396
MDADGVISTVREEQATELDRLGSEKALIAATGATLEADAVLEAAATREHALAAVLSDWGRRPTAPSAGRSPGPPTRRQPVRRHSTRHPVTPTRSGRIWADSRGRRRVSVPVSSPRRSFWIGSTSRW